MSTTRYIEPRWRLTLRGASALSWALVTNLRALLALTALALTLAGAAAFVAYLHYLYELGGVALVAFRARTSIELFVGALAAVSVCWIAARLFFAQSVASISGELSAYAADAVELRRRREFREAHVGDLSVSSEARGGELSSTHEAGGVRVVSEVVFDEREQVHLEARVGRS